MTKAPSREEDKNIKLQQLIKNSFQSAIAESDGISWSGFALPETECMAGFDGNLCSLRIPVDSSQTTDWLTLNNMIRRRTVSSGKDMFVQVGFEMTNFDHIGQFLVDLIQEVDLSEKNPVEILDDLIKKMHHLWDTVVPALSLKDMIGIIGELLVLEKLVEHCDTKAAIDSWKAPDKKLDLHDFQTKKAHIEVKTTSQTPGRFYVEHLDQMDHVKIHPKKLAILYVSIVEGSEFSIADLAYRIAETCSKSGLKVAFEERLLQRGYRPGNDEGHLGNLYDLASMSVHWVNENTPIYTAGDLANLSPAVVELHQTIDPAQVDFKSINSNDWKTIAKKIGI